MRIYFNFVTVFVLAAILSSFSLNVEAQSRGSRSVLRGSFESPKAEVETKDSLVACDSGKFDFAAGPGTVVGSGFGNSRTYSNSGTSVTVRAFSRDSGNGAWETASVGQYGGAGLGVTNRDSGEGSDPNHKVDNVGTRKDYLLLEFSQPIVVPVAYLRSITNDSDIRVWFGNGGSIPSLSDATLASFSQTANGGGNGGTGAARSATFGAAAVSANKFVIAAETLSDLDDYFKVEAIDFTCPTTPPNLIIVKRVLTIDQTDASTQSFGFTATNTNQASFSLVDGNVVGPDRVSLTVNTGATATVTEGFTPAWTLSDLSCTGTAAANVNINFLGAAVSVTPQAGETVTCTFTNVLLRASAARATISGRATLMNTRGVGGALITLQNLGTGETKSVVTNTFGYYTIPEVEVGNFYMVTISHRRYQFAESSRFIDMTDNVTGFDFTGGY